jgi:hypothetical protein
VLVFLLYGLLASLIGTIAVGIFGASNLVWGEDNQYGRVDVPGTGVIHLPKGTVKVSVALALPGRGNATPDLPLPSDLSLEISAVNGSASPVVTVDVGLSSNANDDQDDTQRQAYAVQVAADGDYRVVTGGDFSGIGINAQLWFGHETPVSGWAIPALGAVLGYGALFLYAVVLPAIRGRRVKAAQ